MDFIDYLDMHFDLEWVSGGEQVKLSGTCPFCGEDRTDLRLYVSVSDGSGFCHHCGTGFGPVQFVKANEGIGYAAAKAMLEDGGGFKKDRTVRGPEGACVFPPITPISDSEKAQVYLSGRDIGMDVVSHFKLYFCKTNITIDEREFYTRNRIIIPVHDLSGRPISWQGRDVTGRALRYLFPPGFKGAEYLYNGWAIPKGSRYLIVCEGCFDVYGWWRAGFKSVVATFGKDITAQQVSMIAGLEPQVLFLALDGDALTKAYEFSEKHGHRFADIRIVKMGYRDADEMSRDELRAALSTAQGYSWSDKILSAIR